MIRFIHAADLHIDSPLRGLERFDGAPIEQLRGATRQALKRLVLLAIDQCVDFVLIAGDLYDGNWIDFHTGLFVREQMVKLKQANIRVFIVQGNHDAHSIITRQLPWPDNVNVFSSSHSETFCLDDLSIAIHGQSFPDRKVPEDLVPNYPKAIENYFNIGLLHTSLMGSQAHDTYAPTSLEILKSKHYDYWALGHIHTRTIIHEAEPRIIFPGNIQGRHANETGAKGCELVLIDRQNDQIKSQFVTLDVVRWHQISIKIDKIETEEAFHQKIIQTLNHYLSFNQDNNNQDHLNLKINNDFNDSDLLHAIRLNISGESILQKLEAKQPNHLDAIVYSAIQDIADFKIWVEKVKLNIHSPIHREQLSQGADALAELLKQVDELTQKENENQLIEFCQNALIDVLSKNKIPLEVLQDAQNDLPDLENTNDLLSLLKDAESTLLARLKS